MAPLNRPGNDFCVMQKDLDEYAKSAKLNFKVDKNLIRTLTMIPEPETAKKDEDNRGNRLPFKNITNTLTTPKKKSVSNLFDPKEEDRIFFTTAKKNSIVRQQPKKIEVIDVEDNNIDYDSDIVMIGPEENLDTRSLKRSISLLNVAELKKHFSQLLRRRDFVSLEKHLLPLDLLTL